MNLSILKYIIAYISAAVMITVAVFVFSYHNNLNLLSQTGGVRVEQARDRLLGQLASFRQLPNYLAKHPKILDALNQPDDTNEFLLNTALITGADNIFVLNKTGTVIATSNYTEPDSYLGANFANKPHVRAALNGRLGFYHALGSNDNGRDFYYARAISTPDNSRGGIVVVQIDVAALEFEWRVDEEVLAFFDSDGVAFVTNRQSLGLLRESPDPNIPVDTRRYPQSTLQPFFKHSKSQIFGHNIWSFQGTKELPANALVISRFIPRIEMTARVFLDTKGAMAAARLQALLAAAVLALIGLGMWALFQRRQRLADLLAIEEKANAKLEARVEKRTEQLHATQHQLIQAGKLTAMGQMSAGISHELNQPMAAIQNFAENGGKLINRGRQDDARDNFNMITQQIDRMSRIIRSLRAFARKEKETVEPVDLQSVITESVNLATARCEREGVTIIQNRPKSPIFVMGGQIRLQQVVINLITNAIDAMTDQNDKKIEIDITPALGEVRLTIRDNGPGFKDAARVFEPFYSTKDRGASKGLGLGLSISYGIIGSFGGDIKCLNRKTGGAEFIVTLKSATEKLAA
jgi:two-component system, NtrC family, C4-dicarboxylate transport sensor histidine kinase DctB